MGDQLGQLDFDRCYRAVDSRDQRFDGWFYTAVTSTGIYCRPSCPATTPRREHIRFYPSSAAAQRAGFRACKRCRPDAAPGSPEWDTRADVVARAMRLIADGTVDREGVPGLAQRLGYTERHLHRMLTAELGAGPLALARAQRAQTARILVETTGLGLAEIAFAAGFGSVRQFNDTLREVYAIAPSQLRAATRSATTRGAATRSATTRGATARSAATRSATTRGATARSAASQDACLPAAPSNTITLRLAYRSPLHVPALLAFFAARTIPGVEEVEADTYRRALRLPHGEATVALTLGGAGYVTARLRLSDLRDLAPAVARCRMLLDLDADPIAVDTVLAEGGGEVAPLAPIVAKEPGVRVPRAADGFEMAIRGIVGQQISVAAARTVLAGLLPPPSDGHALQPGRLRAFPSPEQVLELPDTAFAMPRTRREAIRAVARAVVGGALDLAPGADRAETVRLLSALPGIGPWTAGYVALRALGDPDVFLATDLGVRRGAASLAVPTGEKDLVQYARRWSPWRSYAMIRIWRHP